MNLVIRNSNLQRYRQQVDVPSVELSYMAASEQSGFKLRTFVFAETPKKSEGGESVGGFSHSHQARCVDIVSAASFFINLLIWMQVPTTTVSRCAGKIQASPKNWREFSHIIHHNDILYSTSQTALLLSISYGHQLTVFRIRNQFRHNTWTKAAT